MFPFVEIGYPGKRNEYDQKIEPCDGKDESSIRTYIRAKLQAKKTDRKRRQ